MHVSENFLEKMLTRESIWAFLGSAKETVPPLLTALHSVMSMSAHLLRPKECQQQASAHLDVGFLPSIANLSLQSP